MAYFSSNFTPATPRVGAGTDPEQQSEDDSHHPSALGDPSLLEGPVSQPGRRGLLRRIELRVGSIS